MNRRLAFSFWQTREKEAVTLYLKSCKIFSALLVQASIVGYVPTWEAKANVKMYSLKIALSPFLWRVSLSKEIELRFWQNLGLWRGRQKMISLTHTGYGVFHDDRRKAGLHFYHPLSCPCPENQPKDSANDGLECRHCK